MLGAEDEEGRVPTHVCVRSRAQHLADLRISRCLEFRVADATTSSTLRILALGSIGLDIVKITFDPLAFARRTAVIGALRSFALLVSTVAIWTTAAASRSCDGSGCRPCP